MAQMNAKEQFCVSMCMCVCVVEEIEFIAVTLTIFFFLVNEPGSNDLFA